MFISFVQIPKMMQENHLIRLICGQKSTQTCTHERTHKPNPSSNEHNQLIHSHKAKKIKINFIKNVSCIGRKREREREIDQKIWLIKERPRILHRNLLFFSFRFVCLFVRWKIYKSLMVKLEFIILVNINKTKRMKPTYGMNTDVGQFKLWTFIFGSTILKLPFILTVAFF